MPILKNRLRSAHVIALSFCSVFAASIEAEAQSPSPSTVVSARGLAMGTGARSTASGVSALAQNPAGMARGRVYHVESIVDYNMEEGSWSLAGAAVDSVTSRVAAGFSGRGVIGGGEDAYNGYDLRLALALPLADVISIGVGARYARLRVDTQEGEEASPNENLKRFTMDASILLQPIEALSISALGYNLINTGSSLAPTLVGGGVGLQIETTFSAGADVLVDLTTFENPTILAGGGLEYLAGEAVPLRLGYEYDTGREVHAMSGGLGYVDENVSLEFSFRQGVSGNRDTRLLLSFRYHVQ